MAQPHDSFFKNMLSHRVLFSELVTQLIAPRLKNKIDAEYIELVNSEWANDFLKKHSADIVLKTRFLDSGEEVYILIENQSTIRPDMNYKIHRYSLELLTAHFRWHSYSAFSNSIVPVVIYQGTKPWPTLNIPTVHLLPQIGVKHYSFELIQLHDMDLSPFENTPHLCAFLGTLKAAATRSPKALESHTLHALAQLEKLEKHDIIVAILHYLHHVFPDETHVELNKLLQPFLYTGESIMGSIAAMYRREGKQEGRQEGHETGKAEAQLTFARTLLQRHYPISEILELIPIDPQRLNQLQEELFQTNTPDVENNPLTCSAH